MSDTTDTPPPASEPGASANPPPRPNIPPPPRKKPQIGDTMPAPSGPADTGGSGAADGDGSGGDTAARRRRRRGGRGRRGKGGGEGGGTAAPSASTGGQPQPQRQQQQRQPKAKAAAQIPIEAKLGDAPIDLDEKSLKRRRGRERKGKPIGRYLMCVTRRDDATHIAILEGRQLIEYYVSRPSDDVAQIHGNVYLGKVQNVLPGMEAAFIDIGTPKNTVLYRGDVQYDADDIEVHGNQSAYRGHPQTSSEHSLPGHQKPHRPQGGASHPRGLPSRPVRRVGPQLQDVRHLQTASGRGAQAAAADPRQRPPARARRDRADGGGERDRRGDRA